MAGETDLDKLLTLLQPKLLQGDYVFCTLPESKYGDLAELNPLACFHEEQGLSLLLEQESARKEGLEYEGVFKGITLAVHSSLDAVGFTAAVSNRLASKGVACNVIAAHYHDHIFVPKNRAKFAMQLLTELNA